MDIFQLNDFKIYTFSSNGLNCVKKKKQLSLGCSFLIFCAIANNPILSPFFFPSQHKSTELEVPFYISKDRFDIKTSFFAPFYPFGAVK